MNLSPVIELKSVSQQFSGIAALQDISFSAQSGRCIGLLGESGAGKTTLIHILGGVISDYQGEMRLHGEPVRFRSPRDAVSQGVRAAYQELQLFEELSIVENIFLGSLNIFERHRQQDLCQDCSRLFERFGIDVDPQTLVRELKAEQKHLIQAARALAIPAPIVVLDELASALSERYTQKLFEIVHDLRANGTAVIFVPHKLSEIREVCDEVIVFRDGKIAGHFQREDFSESVLIEVMTGRDTKTIFPMKRKPKERSILLQVNGLSAYDPSREKQILDDVSFEIREGEVLGVTGLVGCGRKELLQALFGSLGIKNVSAEIWRQGHPVNLKSPSAAVREGIALVSQKTSSVVPFMDIRSNLTLATLKTISRWGKISNSQEAELTDYYIRVLRIHPSEASTRAHELTSGNQQKVGLGRWLTTQPKLLLLEDPTFGVEVSVKEEIYHLIRQLVDQGLTIVLASSSVSEIVNLSDRVLVMREGRIEATLEHLDINEHIIMQRAAA